MHSVLASPLSRSGERLRYRLDLAAQLRAYVNPALTNPTVNPESCLYCHGENHVSGEHGTAVDPEIKMRDGDAIDYGLAMASKPLPGAAPLPAVSDVDFYTAREIQKDRIDPFLPSERICYGCHQALRADDQLPPLRATWSHRKVMLFFCNDCARSGPLGPVSESYEALRTADKDHEEAARELLMDGCREARKKAIVTISTNRSKEICDDLNKAFAALTSEERRLVDLEIFTQNVPAMGVLATGNKRLLTNRAALRIAKERAIKTEAAGVREQLPPEGKQRVHDALVAWEAFNAFMPPMSYPGDDALSSAITSGNADGALSMVSARIDGALPARGAYLPPSDGEDDLADSPDDPLRKKHKAPHGFVENAATERRKAAKKRREVERKIVAVFVLSPYKAELSQEDLNVILLWLGGASQTELAQLSGRSQPTVHRLLKRIIMRAVTLHGAK